MISTSVFQRDFSAALDVPVRLSVESMTWHALGGCDAATITASGSRIHLRDMVGYLRCPVVVWNGGKRAWWGYVHQVEVEDGSRSMGVTLDGMTNRVRVVYSDAAGRGQTAWAEDTLSRLTYGKKEQRLSQIDLTATTAAALRDQILAQYKLPLPVSDRGRGGKLGVTLHCRGWWQTLDWRVSEVAPTAAISYTNVSGITAQAVGSSDENQMVMQQVTVGASDVYLLGIDLLVAKVGTPQDELTVGVYELDKDGNPEGDNLATGSIFGPLVGGSYGWVSTWFNEATMRASRQYGVRIGRSGDVDASNYYTVQVNPGLGYAGGALRLNDGETWKARATDADLVFSIFANAQVATTTQVASHITSFGEFFTATDLESASGINKGSYQDGANTVMRVLEDLLAMGRSGGRQYLAEVTDQRRLRVYEEPLPSDPPYRVGEDGTLRTKLGDSVMLGSFPAGQWCKLSVPLAGSADNLRLADFSLQFIESVEWAVGEGLRPTFRGQVTAEEMLRVNR